MRILEINSVCGIGSTGKICVGIAELAKAHGHVCEIAYGRMATPEKYRQESYRITSDLQVKMHALQSRLFGKTGTYSKGATKRFLSWLDDYQPDVVHLHNLHGYYINIPMLFHYLKEHKIRVVWTLHDCWPFTGHCAHFDLAGCEKWKQQCDHCPQKSGYPKSLLDRSSLMYQLKQELFCGVKDLTIVTPSQWLAGLVKESFLLEYDVKVIHNGIDLRIFQPTQSHFRKQYHCEEKFVLLGVAFDWNDKKGLDVFLELANRLDDSYQIVLVGTNEQIEKTLPKCVIPVRRTNSAKELAEIYTAADLFVNPTREDNFPTVNIEALACGTPVLTFATGGSPEVIDDTCGVVVEKNNINQMIREIERIRRELPFSGEDCLVRAKSFDQLANFKEYIQLYERGLE